MKETICTAIRIGLEEELKEGDYFYFMGRAYRMYKEFFDRYKQSTKGYLKFLAYYIVREKLPTTDMDVLYFVDERSYELVNTFPEKYDPAKYPGYIVYRVVASSDPLKFQPTVSEEFFEQYMERFNNRGGHNDITIIETGEAVVEARFND